jgi:mannose-6-phosphate isomerase class I
MIVKIQNQARDYAWGSTTLMAEALGLAPTGGPMA